MMFSASGARRWPALMGAVLVATTLAACGDDDKSDDSSTSTTVAEGDGEAAGDKVVLVTYDAFALPEEAAAAFEERYGAAIEVVRVGDTGSMLSSALLTAGSPDGDVLFGVDNTSATEVLEAPLLEPIAPEGLDSVAPDALLPGELGKVLVPIDTGDVCINADAGWFESEGLEVPTSFEDLADARYKDLLVVESPVNSSPGLAFLLGTIETFGQEGWEGYWESLRANGVRVAPSWDDAYYNDYTVSGGDRPMVVSYASSPPAEVVFSEGALTEPASTVLESSCVSQVEYAGVLAGAEHPELAADLVEFMLGDEWQSALPLTNFVYPVTDAPLPEEFTKWAPKPADPLQVDPVEVGEGREEWIEQWRAVME